MKLFVDGWWFIVKDFDIIHRSYFNLFASSCWYGENKQYQLMLIRYGGGIIYWIVIVFRKWHWAICWQYDLGLYIGNIQLTSILHVAVRTFELAGTNWHGRQRKHWIESVVKRSVFSIHLSISYLLYKSFIAHHMIFLNYFL